LNIAFQTKALRTLSESGTLAKRNLGDAVAASLYALLSDVEVARSPEELPLGFMPSKETPTAFHVSLPDGYVAVFESNHSRDRETKSGQTIDWKSVNRVKLTGIEKTND
jgi:hypothetical protein